MGGAVVVAFSLPLVLYYHYVDGKRSTAFAAIAFSCTIASALLLTLLVPLDICYAATAEATRSGDAAAEPVDSLSRGESDSPSLRGSAADGVPALGFFAASKVLASLGSSGVLLTRELLLNAYLAAAAALVCCSFVLTPAAIFHATAKNKQRVSPALQNAERDRGQRQRFGR